MKKISLLLIAAFVTFLVAINSCQQHKPAGTGDTETKSLIDSVGTVNWTLTVIVKDGNTRVVQGATVNLPCAGLSQITDASGTAAFAGEGNCPCNADNSATVSKKGMCSNIVVPLTNGCGYTYSATCQ